MQLKVACLMQVAVLLDLMLMQVPNTINTDHYISDMFAVYYPSRRKFDILNNFCAVGIKQKLVMYILASKDSMIALQWPS